MAADVLLLIVAGIGAGLTGSTAGLASLFSYPALLAVGLPPVLIYLAVYFQGALGATPTGAGLMLLLVGAGLAIALNEGLRSKVLDMLFGKEEEFEYSSTTSPQQSGTNAAPVGSTS